MILFTVFTQHMLVKKLTSLIFFFVVCHTSITFIKVNVEDKYIVYLKLIFWSTLKLLFVIQPINPVPWKNLELKNGTILLLHLFLQNEIPENLRLSNLKFQRKKKLLEFSKLLKKWQWEFKWKFLLKWLNFKYKINCFILKIIL